MASGESKRKAFNHFTPRPINSREIPRKWASDYQFRPKIGILKPCRNECVHQSFCFNENSKRKERFAKLPKFSSLGAV